MSMIGHAFLISEQRMRALLQQPETVYALIDGAYNDPAAGFVDMDKAWHCLHFLLTGTSWEGEPPLDFIVKGGVPVGEEDVGYGPARVFTATEVAAIAAALSPIGAKQLLARFDLMQLEALEIYPGRWDAIDVRSEYELGYFLGPFEELKRITERARAEQLAMIVWLS
jgi:hypothetical protein